MNNPTIYYKPSRQVWAAIIDLGIAPNGKRIRREITSKSRNAVIQKRREVLEQVARGTFTIGKTPRVSAWLPHWLENIAKPRIRPHVAQNYASYIRVHIVPSIGARRIDKLTPDDIRFLHTTMRDNGASQRTIQAVHNTLSKSLTDAVREGIIFSNPCDRMDRPRAASEPRDAFSRGEVGLIIETAKRMGAGTHSRWLAALILGARQAELLGLEWDRVDLDAGTVDVSWQLQRIPWSHGEECACVDGTTPARCLTRRPDVPEGFEVRPCHGGVWFTRPKTAASVRVVPLPSILHDALRTWREECTSDGLVWKQDGKPINPARDRAEWKRICQTAGVRQLTVHSARHTMVSMLLDAGVSPEVIRQIAGHSTILSTRQYMHVSTEQARSALELLGD
ncbi:tyrosine-type recombinase/integrase [Corynebacterium auriscanis]|uniref:tyrosine-type recombinase/integrase n=1 Tax=Corynebacterium auriscanis TaxID=99807 RepID=UPI003CED7418